MGQEQSRGEKGFRVVTLLSFRWRLGAVLLLLKMAAISAAIVGAALGFGASRQTAATQVWMSMGGHSEIAFQLGFRCLFMRLLKFGKQSL